MSFSFYSGEVLLIDKPYGWSSFKAVHHIKKAISKHPSWTDEQGPHPVKIGHAGTLDPLATGLLILCTGKKTKHIQDFMNLEKVYTGVFFIGATTPCFDREKPVDAEYSITHITSEHLEKVRQQFIGTQYQIPPLFSAIQIKGRRAYEIARSGQTVALQPRAVSISQLEFKTWNPPFLHFKVTCSKGTYIRSLARDIGQALHSGAYVYDLKREQIGRYNLSEAKSPQAYVECLHSI
jgi:tRNA pseudouridine55 synthase